MPEDTVTIEHPIDTDSEEVLELKRRIVQLEEVVIKRDTELAAFSRSVAELQERLSNTGQVLNDAVAEYRTLVLQANPDITEELISGESVPAINKSLENAKNLVSKVRQSVEKNMASVRIPIGSPGRQTPDLSALSPREKIHYAIGGKK